MSPRGFPTPDRPLASAHIASPLTQLSHRVSMLLYRLLFASLHNDSKMVRPPAPRDHPPALETIPLAELAKPAPLSPAEMTSEPHSLDSGLAFYVCAPWPVKARPNCSGRSPPTLKFPVFLSLLPPLLILRTDACLSYDLVSYDLVSYDLVSYDLEGKIQRCGGGYKTADNTNTDVCSCTSWGLSGEVRRGFYPPGVRQS